MDIGANGRTYACRAILASAVLSLSCMAFAQQAAKPANTGMLHHISGVWNFDENGGPGAASNLVPKDVGLTPWGVQKFKENGNRTTGNSYNNCEPLGFISYPSHPHPIEILQTPDRIVFFHEVKSPLPDDLDGDGYCRSFRICPSAQPTSESPWDAGRGTI